jgi:NAD(P)-dependent dehydrogenase (short-subunit alcohol dehydrogenase family)
MAVSLRIFSHLVLALFALVPAMPLSGSESNGTVLITGANRGIGLALAEKFQASGYKVIGTARNPDKANELKELGVRTEQLDVTDPVGVSALAQRLNGVPLDILINNAGIKGHDADDLADLEIDKLQQTLDVNTLGPLRVIQALFPNMRAGDRKVFANISSMMGSMEMNTWGCCLGYRASKSALNSFTKTLSVEYKDDGFVFVTMHPGYVQTDMNDGQGNITPVQSAEGLFNVISKLSAEDNGRYYDWNGKELPW